MPPAPIVPREGWHVLHLYFHIDPNAMPDAAYFRRLLMELRSKPDMQILVFSVVGNKADVGFMITGPDLLEVDGAGKQLAQVCGPGALENVYGCYSLTERSEYTTSDEDYAAQTLVGELKLDPASEEYATKLEEFRVRMEKYLNDRLYPNLADWPVMCFYTMQKRRDPGQNWYALSFDARKKLMAGHARVGRTYAGRIRQLITGCTGLDDDEWGVTLFAKDVSEIKSIVYEMRFDEVSAQYAEFGPFFIGIQMEPDALLAHVLPSRIG